MEWISVKDRLPEEGVEVLIYCNPDIVQAVFSVGYWKGSFDVTDYMNDGFVPDRRICKQGSDYDYVTHWMPLPEPPKS